MGGLIRARNLQFFAGGVHEFHDRAHVPGAGRALFGVHDDHAGQAGHFIDMARDRDALDDIGEPRLALDLGDHRVGMRVPGGDPLAGLGIIAVVGGEHRAIGNLIALALTPQFIQYGDLARAGDHDPVAAFLFQRLDVPQF